MKKVLLSLIVIMSLVLSGCEKNKPHFHYVGPCHCGVDNPLEKLEWLRKMAEKFEAWRGKTHSSISICTYDSGKDGFLVDYNENVADGLTGFYDCDGNLLCTIGGIAGNLCPEYNIDHSSISKIYCNYPVTVAAICDKR